MLVKRGAGGNSLPPILKKNFNFHLTMKRCMFLIQDGESKGSDHSGVGNDCEDRTRASSKENDNSKPESPFSTLVKMTTGKNPTTFSLPPELQCNTFFPGKF